MNLFRKNRSSFRLTFWGVRGSIAVPGKEFAGSAADYLTEESRDVLGRDELDAFHDDVDAIRDDVERLAARVSCLKGVA